MKKLIIITLVMVPLITFGQSNYFKLPNDTIYSDHDFNIHFKLMINDLPKDYTLTPIIYHKSEFKDSIINYVYFQKIWWGDKIIDPSKFEIVYKQDSSLLFLDKKLPEFTLKDLNEVTFNSSQLIGKPTLINFWAINCAGCIVEIPQLNELKEKYKGKVNFVAISLDSGDSVQDFLKMKPFNFYHLTDGYNYSNKILKQSGIPVNMFLDKNGYIREIKKLMPLRSDRSAGTPDDLTDLSNQDFADILEKLLK